MKIWVVVVHKGFVDLDIVPEIEIGTIIPYLLYVLAGLVFYLFSYRNRLKINLNIFGYLKCLLIVFGYCWSQKLSKREGGGGGGGVG